MRIFLAKTTAKVDQKKYLLLIVFKTNPWTYKIKDLNVETKIEIFYKKELLLSKL